MEARSLRYVSGDVSGPSLLTLPVSVYTIGTMKRKAKRQRDLLTIKYPVSMTPSQRDSYHAAARKAMPDGSTATWIRSVLDREVRRIRKR